MGELEKQRKLNTLAAVSLISIPLTGPLGIVAATLAIVGKEIRKSNPANMASYDEDIARLKQKRLERREKQRYEEFQTSINSFLNREHERQKYGFDLEQGKKLLENHLSHLPYEDYSEIKQIEIYRKEPPKFFGVELNNGRLETRIIK
jgi:hypothetical protein